MTDITNKIMLEQIIRSLENKMEEYSIKMSKVGRQLEVLNVLSKLPDGELELIKGIKKFNDS